MEKLQIALREKFAFVLTVKDNVCQLATSVNGQDIAELKSSLGKAEGHYKTISVSTQEMEHLRSKQLSLLNKMRGSIPVDYFKRYEILMKSSGSLVRKIREKYEKAYIYDRFSFKSPGMYGLEGPFWLAEQYGVDLQSSVSIIKSADELVLDAKKRASVLDDMIKELKAANQRIDSSKHLKKTSQLCLAKIQNALKQAKAAAKKDQGPFFVYCFNNKAKVGKKMPYNTSLGIGEFDTEKEAKAFAKQSNRDGSCEAESSACPKGTVQIPDLLYRSGNPNVMKSFLRRNGLNLGTIRRKDSYSTPAGQIMSQYPYVHECVKPGTTVNIVVSNGGKKPDVPADKSMTSMIIRPAAITLDVGQVRHFTAVATYSDDSTDAVTHNASWSGDGSGNTFTAKTPGTYTVTAAYNNFVRTATIIVRQPELVSIAVVPASASVKPGKWLLLRLDANFDHSRFEDVTDKAYWSGIGVDSQGRFYHDIAGTFVVTASYGGLTASTTITVKKSSWKKKHTSSSGSGGTTSGGATTPTSGRTTTPTGVGQPGPDDPTKPDGKDDTTDPDGTAKPDNTDPKRTPPDDLAAQMMNDPTRSGTPGDLSQNSPDVDGFSPLPVRPDQQRPITDDDNWAGIDLDQQALAQNSARRSRDDNLNSAADQRDRDKWQAWDKSAAADKDDRKHQDAMAQQALAGSRQQAQAANDATQKAWDQQLQQQDAHQKRMEALEKAAAARAQPAAPKGAGKSGSGGLSDVTVSQNNITIKIWDHGTVDGDIIILNINHVPVTDEVTLKGPGSPFIYNASLPQQTNRIEIHAVNTGSVGPNTASVSTSHVTQGKANQEYSINQEENASYGITVSF